MLLPAISMAFPSDDGTRCWLGACVDFESHHGCRPRADLLREYEGGYLASDLMSNSSSLLGDGFLALDSRHGMPLDHDKDDQLLVTGTQVRTSSAPPASMPVSTASGIGHTWPPVPASVPAAPAVTAARLPVRAAPASLAQTLAASTSTVNVAARPGVCVQVPNAHSVMELASPPYAARPPLPAPTPQSQAFLSPVATYVPSPATTVMQPPAHAAAAATASHKVATTVVGLPYAGRVCHPPVPGSAASPAMGPSGRPPCPPPAPAVQRKRSRSSDTSVDAASAYLAVPEGRVRVTLLPATEAVKNHMVGLGFTPNLTVTVKVRRRLLLRCAVLCSVRC